MGLVPQRGLYSLGRNLFKAKLNLSETNKKQTLSEVGKAEKKALMKSEQRNNSFKISLKNKIS